MGLVCDIDHIGISVSDMTRAIAFFRDVLGAQVTEPHLYDDPRIGTVVGLPGLRNVICQASVGGKRFELLQYVAPEGRQADNHRPCDPGHMHVALAVEDIEAFIARMKLHGFEPANPVQRGMGGHGLSAAYCYGFDGLVFELIEYPKAP
ncbi:VOC family protein [Novosphingobium sp. PS1R-30]|uniref:VOC family protein n=1 Tax=Novosphingobium anseongense TaxID=3133436 RepID=A0ABU8S2C8_9SPHN